MTRFTLAAALILGTMTLAQAQTAPTPAPAPGKAVAIFAAGCFWCTESDFDKVDGVTATISGYTGGKELNPTYNRSRPARRATPKRWRSLTTPRR